MPNNVELVQQAFGEFGKGNFQAIVDRCTEDVVWGSYDNPGVPHAGTFKGKEGVSKFFNVLRDNVEFAEFTPREFYSQGDTVIVRGYHEARVKKTGRNFRHDWAMIFKIRDSKVASFFCYVDTRDQAQAFAAPSGGESQRRYERPGESIPESAQAGTSRRSK